MIEVTWTKKIPTVPGQYLGQCIEYGGFVYVLKLTECGIEEKFVTLADGSCRFHFDEVVLWSTEQVEIPPDR